MTPRRLDDADAPDREGQAVVGGGHDVAGDAHLAQSSSGADAGVVEAGRRRIDAAMLEKATKKRWLLRPASLREHVRSRGRSRANSPFEGALVVLGFYPYI